jgi:hypothetical protein
MWMSKETTMSYSIQINKAEFRIRAENQRAALLAARKLPETKYAYVDRNWRKARDLYATFEAWGYEPTMEDGDGAPGDIIELSTSNEVLGDEERLFEAIAPYVEPGSYIEYAGRDGDMWRWSFDGKKLVTLRPRIEWVAE